MALSDAPSVLVKVAEYAKAVAAAATAGAASLSLALADGQVSVGEGVTIALAVLGALGIVAGVPNRAKRDDA